MLFFWQTLQISDRGDMGVQNFNFAFKFFQMGVPSQKFCILDVNSQKFSHFSVSVIGRSLDCVGLRQSSVIRIVHRNVGLKCFLKFTFVIIVSFIFHLYFTV